MRFLLNFEFPFSLNGVILIVFYCFLEIMKQRADESNRQIAHELETERAHHQRLVKEHGRLQQRYDMILLTNYTTCSI